MPRVKIGGCETVGYFLAQDLLIGGEEQDSISPGQDGVEQGDWGGVWGQARSAMKVKIKKCR